MLLRLTGKGTVWFDDVVFERVDDRGAIVGDRSLEIADRRRLARRNRGA